MRVKYTRELLEEAARETTNFDDAVRWCGGTPTPGSRRYMRQRMAEAGIDTSRFALARARDTEETLRELVACSRSVADVVRRLGISPVGGNRSRIGRRMAVLRIDTLPCAPAQRGHRRESRG